MSGSCPRARSRSEVRRASRPGRRARSPSVREAANGRHPGASGPRRRGEARTGNIRLPQRPISPVVKEPAVDQGHRRLVRAVLRLRRRRSWRTRGSVRSGHYVPPDAAEASVASDGTRPLRQLYHGMALRFKLLFMRSEAPCPILAERSARYLSPHRSRRHGRPRGD